MAYIPQGSRGHYFYLNCIYLVKWKRVKVFYPYFYMSNYLPNSSELRTHKRAHRRFKDEYHLRHSKLAHLVIESRKTKVDGTQTKCRFIDGAPSSFLSCLTFDARAMTLQLTPAVTAPLFSTDINKSEGFFRSLYV